MRAHDLTGSAVHIDAALGAARTTYASQWIGTSQCHGLAGSIEVLIDAAAKTGSAEYLEAARVALETLIVYREPRGWPSDVRTTWSPDYMVGEAGVGAALLRLAYPSSSHLMSLRSLG
jgi:lantibiotic modifying enzyme